MYERTPVVVQDTPTMQFIQLLLQRASQRDYVGLYHLIQQVEQGIIELGEPLHSLVLEYKRISSGGVSC